MERLDRWTDPDVASIENRCRALTFRNYGLTSDLFVSQKLSNITIKTIPVDRCSQPKATPALGEDEIDWNSLANVLDEAYAPESRFASPVRAGNLSVRVLPSATTATTTTTTPLMDRLGDTKTKPGLHSHRLDPYDRFVKNVLEDVVPAESDESDDEDFTILNSNGQIGDEEEEFKSDKTVQISMKELLDLFEEEYFVRGKKISVDRLRKRLEHLDSDHEFKLGFSGELLKRLDEQVCQTEIFVELSGMQVGGETHETGPRDVEMHMPSLDRHDKQDAKFVFPTLRLSMNMQKVDLIRRTWSPSNTPDAGSRASLKRPTAAVKLVNPGSAFFSDSYYTLLAFFQDSFLPNLCLAMTKKQLEDSITKYMVDRFMPCEDKYSFPFHRPSLLLLGLKKYGIGSWDNISSQLIPTRTTRQLQVRFKNMTSRRAPDNPLKAFYDELMKPLSRVEEEFLYRGVHRFGKDFHRISKHFLPHRPASVLQRLWEALDEARRNTQ